MHRLLGIRIIRWQLKLVYVVGAIVMSWAIVALLRALATPEILELLITLVFDVAALLFGARVFRGRGEAIEPPRPWWRMTARPTLSRRLGVLFFVLGAGSLLAIILTAVGAYEPIPPASMSDSIAIYVTTALEYGAFAYLYLNSTVRLTRLGVPPKPPKVPKAPKFRPTVKLG
jgi:hypothetical protein